MTDAQITKALKALRAAPQLHNPIDFRQCTLGEWTSLLQRKKYKMTYKAGQIDVLDLIGLLSSHCGI